MQLSIGKLIAINFLVFLLIFFVYPPISSSHYGSFYTSQSQANQNCISFVSRETGFSKGFENIQIDFYGTEKTPSPSLKDFSIKIKGEWYKFNELTENVFPGKPVRENLLGKTYEFIYSSRDSKSVGSIQITFKNNQVSCFNKDRGIYTGNMPEIKYKDHLVELPLSSSQIRGIFDENSFSYETFGSNIPKYQKLWIIFITCTIVLLLYGGYHLISYKSSIKMDNLMAAIELVLLLLLNVSIFYTFLNIYYPTVNKYYGTGYSLGKVVVKDGNVGFDKNFSRIRVRLDANDSPGNPNIAPGKFSIDLDNKSYKINELSVDLFKKNNKFKDLQYKVNEVSKGEYHISLNALPSFNVEYYFENNKLTSFSFCKLERDTPGPVLKYNDIKINLPINEAEMRKIFDLKDIPLNYNYYSFTPSSLLESLYMPLLTAGYIILWIIIVLISLLKKRINKPKPA